jgi:serine phosphatase RsbU (regulator of sigma subunit)
MTVDSFSDLLAEPKNGDLFRFDDEDELLTFDDDEPSPPEGQAWKILIVDDDEEVHQVTRMVLSDLHFDGRPAAFMSAYSGAEARTLLRDHPDLSLVLLDVVMEREDAGLRLVHHLREELDNRLTRIILRTGQPGRAPERHVILHYDINDYREKTELSSQQLFTSVLSSLRAYRAIRQLEEMNRTLEEQVAARTAELCRALEELERHRDQLAREHDLAKQVFARVARPGCLEAANLDYWLAPMDVTNGDLLLAAPKAGGGQYVMFGDFTGHGLSAAIGALPVADIFYRLARKGRPLARIIAAVNDALKERLPTGLFLAACFMEIDADGRLRVWNGGAPDALLVDPGGAVKARLESTDLPLGVVDSTQLGLSLQRLEAGPCDRLLVYSDGLVEARAPDGGMFGEARLLDCLARRAEGGLVEAIRTALERFRAGAPQSDDITVLELAVDLEGCGRTPRP